MSQNFALIGAAGFIAPQHMKAIRETGNRLVAFLDKHDAVGIIDSFFPDAEFFAEFERFDRHIEKLKRRGSESRIHYVSICSPNYLHDAHIRFALRVGADAICEKPLVLNPWNVDPLEEMEKETGRRVWTVLQLRLHPVIRELKRRFEQAPRGEKHDIELTYIVSRGRWYSVSWKGDLSKSGGIATNIGTHFFDMLMWIFGQPVLNVVHLSQPDKVAGFLELENARVRWFLSMDSQDLPESVRAKGERTFRCVSLDGQEIEFSDGFTDLHTEIYREILAGRGFGIEDVRPSVSLVHEIRNAKTEMNKGEHHPFLSGGNK